MGDMTDMIALNDPDIEDDLYNEHAARYKTCRYCGLKHCTWTMTNNGWRLKEPSGAIHACNQHKQNTPEVQSDLFHIGDVFDIDGRLAILALVEKRDIVNMIFLDNGRCGEEVGICYKVTSRSTFSIDDVLHMIQGAEDYTYDDIKYLGPCNFTTTPKEN